MKTPLLITVAVAATFIGTSQLRSQAPAARQSPIEAARTMKAQNQKILEQQAATLERLAALKKEAEQMRIFARRS